jgi:TP901 family phage tail tape measure protein
MSGALSAGKVSISVLPETKGFKELLRSALASETGSFNALGVGIGKKVAEGLGAGLIAVGALSAKMAVEMSASDAKIQGNAQITAKSAAAIGDAFLKTAGQSTFSGHEMAVAFAPVSAVVQTLSGHVLDAASSLTIMKHATDLAEASGQPLVDVTGSLVAILRSYKMGTNGAEEASNILFNTSRNTGIGISELTTSVIRLHARLGNASPTLKDTGALILDLASHGVTGSRALMMMTAGMTTLLSGGKATTEVLKILGVHVYDANGKFVGMQSVLGQLQPKLAGMTDQQRRYTEQALFGKSAAGALNDTIMAGAAGYTTAAAAVTKKNAVDAAAAANAKSLEGMIKNLRSAVSDYATLLGEKVIPIITSAVTWLTHHKVIVFALAGVITTVLMVALTMWTVQLVKNAATQAVQFTKMIAGWIATSAAAIKSGVETAYVWSLYAAESIKGAATTVVQLAIQGAKWIWSGVVALASAAQMAAAWLIAMGPIVLVVAAVVGIAVLIVKNWDTIRRVTTETWNKVFSAVKTAVTDVVNFVTQMPGKILKALGDVGKYLFDSGKNLILGLIHGMENMATGAYDAVKKVVKGVLDHFHLGFLISSPSKVTQTIGEQVMAGLGIGIDKGAAKAQKAASAATKKVIAEHTKMLAKLDKDNAKVQETYAKMNAVIATALNDKSKLIAAQSARDSAAQDTYNDAAFNLNRTFNQDKFKLDRDYQDKKNTLDRTYNDAVATAQKTYDDTAVKDKQKHSDTLLQIQKTYDDKLESLNKAALAKQQSIVQKSIDLLRGAYTSATQVDVGSMFSSGSGEVSGLLDSLKAKLDGAKTLASNAAALAAKGFSQTFIQQVVGQGTDIGNQMSGAILNATPEAAAQLKDLYSQIQDVSETGVNALAAQMNSGAKLATSALTDEYAQVAIDLKDSLALAYSDLTAANLAENISFTDSVAASLKTLNDAKASAKLTLDNGLADAAKTYSDSLFDMNTTLQNGLADAAKVLQDALTASAAQFNTDIDNLQTSTLAKMATLQASLQATAALIASLAGSSAGAKVLANAPKTPNLVTAPSSGSLDMASAAVRAAALAQSPSAGQARLLMSATDAPATSADITALGNKFDAALQNQARLQQTLARSGGPQ